MFTREQTRIIDIGGTKIGGGNPIAVQSMTNTNTEDANATIEQILRLEEAGCELIRVTVNTKEAAEAIPAIKKAIHIPLIADIHYDYRLALAAIRGGVDKVRINPGNIGGEERIAAVTAAAKERHLPIRIGVNSGSLEKDILEKYGRVTAEGLVESALRHVRLLEKHDFGDICVAIKSSDVPTAIRAYGLLAEKIDYPLHVGITEAGTLWSGTVKSAAGIGAILSMGIGDTVRVSLTGDPAEEVACAYEILKDLHLRQNGVTFTSCPTCGRTKYDMIPIANEVERRCRLIRKNIHVAVMGCDVNGIGEAREADIGIAGGNGCGWIFKKGEKFKMVPEAELIDALMAEIEKM